MGGTWIAFWVPSVDQTGSHNLGHLDVHDVYVEYPSITDRHIPNYMKRLEIPSLKNYPKGLESPIE